MKKLLVFNIFCAISLNAMESQLGNALKIQDSSVRASRHLGNIELYCDDNGFHVFKDGITYEVKSYDTDPILRKINKKQLAQVLAGTSIRVSQLSNDDYKLALEGGLKGGGVFGAMAGFWAGKVAVHAAAHGTIWLVSLAAGPAAPAVASILSATLAVPIEAMSNVVAVGTAITGGTLTGPV